MKFGVRECADVVFRAKTKQKIGNRIFYKDEPVIYFDTLKTSSLEGAATTVYAQGGRGNPRLVSWDGERTVTFTMEDALISPVGFSILSGAGIVDASQAEPVKIHVTERVTLDAVSPKAKAFVEKLPYEGESGSTERYIYVFKLNKGGEVDSEPVLFKVTSSTKTAKGYEIEVADTNAGSAYTNVSVTDWAIGDPILVDYYTKYDSGAFQIDITPDKFGGAFYMEASTLWRDQSTGVDYPAEFVIPNLRVQSNFTFTMASSGDPSSFTFTCDAFPDYTRFDKTKKVLASIQIVGASSESENIDYRSKTNAESSIAPSNSISAIDDNYVYIINAGSTDFDASDKFVLSGTSTVSYESGDTDVLTVDASTGIVTAGDNAGVTEIIATAFTDKTASIVVKVVEAAG